MNYLDYKHTPSQIKADNGSPVYRVMIQHGTMINNDDYIVYTTDVPDEEYREAYSRMFGKGMCPKRIVLARPVFAEEIQAGLVVNQFEVPRPLKREPFLTSMLDAYYRTLEQFALWSKVSAQKVADGKEPISPAWVVAHTIAYHYYDCMSGGMPNGLTQLMLYAISALQLDLDTPVYPGKGADEDEGEGGKGEWYTLGDFVADMNDRHDKLPMELGNIKLPPLLNP